MLRPERELMHVRVDVVEVREARAVAEERLEAERRSRRWLMRQRGSCPSCAGPLVTPLVLRCSVRLLYAERTYILVFSLMFWSALVAMLRITGPSIWNPY